MCQSRTNDLCSGCGGWERPNVCKSGTIILHIAVSVACWKEGRCAAYLMRECHKLSYAAAAGVIACAAVEAPVPLESAVGGHAALALHLHITVLPPNARHVLHQGMSHRTDLCVDKGRPTSVGGVV